MNENIIEILTPYVPYILLWFALWFCVTIPFLAFTETGRKISDIIIGFRFMRY